MRFDVETQVMTKQTVTTGTVVSADSYELGVAGSDPSIGERLSANFFPDSDPNSDATYRLEVIQADNAALSTNKEVLAASKTYTSAEFVKGKEFEVPIPQGSISKKFIGTQIVVTGGTLPTVDVNAYFGRQGDTPVNKNFPKNVDAKI